MPVMTKRTRTPSATRAQRSTMAHRTLRKQHPHVDTDLKSIKRLVVIDAKGSRYFVFKGHIVISSGIVSERTLDHARSHYPQGAAFMTYQSEFNTNGKK